MGVMDRLRAMFGGSKDEEPKDEEVEEELAAERVQHDIDQQKTSVAGKYEMPSSFDERR